MDSEHCLLCDATTVSKYLYEVRKCRNCTFLYLSREERALQQSTFHLRALNDVDQAKLAYLKKKYPKDNHARKDIYKKYAALGYGWYGETIAVYDIGASGGFFLYEVEKLGGNPANFHSLEVEPEYVQLTKDYYGYSAELGNAETHELEKKFHLITMYDVLEHVDKFWQVLEKAHTALHTDGRVLLKLPNERWAHLKYKLAKITSPKKIPHYLYLSPGGHLNYWNNDSIKQLKKAGFIVESFEYAKPTRQQFGNQYGLRMVAYWLDKVFHTNLFPEFVVILKKVS